MKLPWPFPRPKKPAAPAAASVSGVWGEACAEAFLQAKQYRTLSRRARVGRRGELDLVMLHGEVVVFVEVKTRKSEAFGRPVQAVDRRKRRVLSRAAVRYLGRLRPRPAFIRFDVVEVIGRPDAGPPVIRHVENAFGLDARYALPYPG